MNGLYDDARRYDLIYADFGEDIGFYREIARESSGPICDLACGTGRVTIPLAVEFPERQLYGVDNSPRQLELAAERAGGEPNLSWIEASMERFGPPERCGLALCALHSLEHLTGEGAVDRFFENLREGVLLPGGLFAFALHLPDPRYLIRDPEALERVGAYGGAEEGFILYERSNYDRAAQLLRLTWYFEPRRSGELERVEYELRLFYPLEMERIVAEHSFELLGRFGWYDRSGLTDQAGTQIYVVRAPS